MDLKTYFHDIERSPVSVGDKVSELGALGDWLLGFRPEDRARWLTLRLKREQSKYRAKGIPEDQWPKSLQGDLKQKIEERGQNGSQG